MIYEERKCPVCSVYFVPRKKNQIYCGEKCSYKAYKKRQNARRFERRIEKEKSTCLICGEEFVKRNSRQILCGKNECRNAWNRKRIKEKGNEKRICLICGKEFDCQKTSNAKCCSGKCRGIMMSKSRTGPVVRLVETRKTRKPKTSLAEINRRAREEHLTYGEYVTKYGL